MKIVNGCKPKEGKMTKHFVTLVNIHHAICGLFLLKTQT